MLYEVSNGKRFVVHHQGSFGYHTKINHHDMLIDTRISVRLNFSLVYRTSVFSSSCLCLSHPIRSRLNRVFSSRQHIHTSNLRRLNRASSSRQHIHAIFDRVACMMPAAITDTAATVAASASCKAATTQPHNPSAVPAVVVTDVAGAVSSATEQARIDAGRRIQLALLPENVFSPLRDRRGKQQRTAVATKNINGSTTVDGFWSHDEVFSPKNQRVPGASAPTTAAVSVADKAVKIGVQEGLDRWALQTSRRESMVLWRHESSRYASPSRIGYHPNHPSASRPNSRPSSAATILRPFSAGLDLAVQQQQQQQQLQRASSALPSRSLPPTVVEDMHAQIISTARGTDGDRFADSSESVAVPSSAYLETVSPHTGESNSARVQTMGQGGGSDAAGERDNSSGGVSAAGVVLERSASACERREESGSGSGSGSRRPGGGGYDRQDSTKPVGGGGSRHDRWDGTNRGGGGEGSSRLLATEGDINFHQEAGEVDDDIYEDLDDEDDGELDQRISILENRFSAVGRERPTSAVKIISGGQATILNSLDPERQTTRQMRGVPRSTRRPPRLPPQQTAAARSTTRRLASAEANGAPRRTNSALNLDHHRPSSFACVEAGGALRLIKSRPASAPANSSLLYQRGVSDPVAALDDRRMRLQRSRAGAGAGAGGRYRPAVAAGEKNGKVEIVNPRPPARDATTAIIYWNRDTDGAKRPTSCATDAATNNENQSRNSRPSSAAFRRWVEARPSVKSAISAVSSARTLGMDDPELLHLQLEMESRRAPMSEAMLARMEDHYEAVVLKNSSPRSQQQAAADRAKRGRQLSQQTKSGGGGGVAINPRGVVGPASSGSRKKGGASASARGRSRSKGKKKAGKSGVGGKKKGRARGSSKGKGKAKGKAKGATNAELMPRKVYPSALAFMAEHFPSEERQGVSLLWMEQEEECRHASEALSRAGVSISRGALRRALVIPTDRPLEACLASLPEPTEGRR